MSSSTQAVTVEDVAEETAPTLVAPPNNGAQVEKKSLDEAAQMLNELALEAEEIEEDQQEMKRNFNNKNLRMLTPEEQQEKDRQAKRQNRTKAQKRADLRKKLQQMKADRRTMTPQQRAAKGSRQMRMTQANIAKAQRGGFGNKSGGSVPDAASLTPAQMDQLQKMLAANPQLAEQLK